MTDRELMQQAADKLSIMVGYPGLRLYHEDTRAVLTALRERLAQPEQEPVAWFRYETVYEYRNQLARCTKDCIGAFPVYTTPPRREWVGLTDGEIYKIDCLLITNITELVIAIEDKLKEKNT